MRAQRAAFGAGFSNAFAHRGDLLLQLAGSAIIVVLNGALWTAATRGQPTIAGIEADALVTYAVAAWIAAGAVSTRVAEELGERVRDGEIAADLLRPASLFGYRYAMDAGRVSAVLLARVGPLLALGATLFPVALPDRLSTWALWALSLAVGHFVSFGLAFLFGLAAARVRYTAGLSLLRTTVLSLFSGALIPLELFGGGAADALRALPFAALAWGPASVFLGRDPAPILLSGVAWGLALWALCELGWRRVATTLTVQGG